MMEYQISTTTNQTSLPTRPKLYPPVFFWLLISWGIINIIQAYVTPISEDEAFYWMYSRYLAWGYFDHPPMIALFIKAGNVLLDGELGTRLTTILAQLSSLIILWKIIDEKNPTAKKVFLFFGIAASIVMFQVFGFIATPDAPLLLFASLFLLGYKRFLEKESMENILLLSIAMAGMMYSKYHGGLVILLIIFSNPRLLIMWKWWLACLFGALFFMPHIIWQLYFDFPTLQYHLVTRARPFNWRNILQYWPNQLLSFNPLFLGLTIFILFRFKPVDVFHRGLYFISAGFLLFFFAATFRGHIEPHWTTVSCLAMLLLVYKYSVESIPIQNYVTRFLIPSILLLLAVRLTLIFDIMPIGLKVHGQKEWCTALESVANDKPVVFFNSYQNPSLYTYYTGKPATSLDGVSYKKTQFDLWNFDEAYVGKKVILVTGKEIPASTPLDAASGRKKYLYPVGDFITTRKIHIAYDFPSGSSIKTGDIITLHATLHNPYPFAVNFQDETLPVVFQASFIKNGKQRSYALALPTPEISTIRSKESVSVSLQFVVPDVPPGKYFFGMVLKAGVIDGTFNSRFIPIDVEKTN